MTIIHLVATQSAALQGETHLIVEITARIRFEPDQKV